MFSISCIQTSHIQHWGRSCVVSELGRSISKVLIVDLLSNLNKMDTVSSCGVTIGYVSMSRQLELNRASGA